MHSASGTTKLKAGACNRTLVNRFSAWPIHQAVSAHALTSNAMIGRTSYFFKCVFFRYYLKCFKVCKSLYLFDYVHIAGSINIQCDNTKICDCNGRHDLLIFFCCPVCLISDSLNFIQYAFTH